MLKQPKSALEAFKILQKLVGESYDGIRGKPPKWMPQQFSSKFKKTQSKLLIEHRYNPDQIKKYIANYPNNLDSLKSDIADVRIPDKILGDIDWLWIIQYAIKVGEQKGLKILLSGETAKSFLHGQKEKEKENLKIGREKGAAKNRARAIAIKALAIQVNDALLRSPISARWSLDKRAEAIAKKLEKGTIEIEGKPTPAKMESGKNYSSETIKGWIIGT